MHFRQPCSAFCCYTAAETANKLAVGYASVIAGVRAPSAILTDDLTNRGVCNLPLSAVFPVRAKTKFYRFIAQLSFKDNFEKTNSQILFQYSFLGSQLSLHIDGQPDGLPVSHLIFTKVYLIVHNLYAVFFKAAFLNLDSPVAEILRKATLTVHRLIAGVFFRVGVIMENISHRAGKLFVSQILGDLGICDHLSFGYGG